MSYGFECTLHSPLTKEDWNKIADVEHEKTTSVTFQTPQGRQVRYIKCEVLDKIRAEINELPSYVAKFNGGDFAIHIDKEKVFEVIDKYTEESEGKE